MNKQLYFDIAATTPMDIAVAEIVHKANIENYGNPSSMHMSGQKSHNIVERSRTSIAQILNCKTSEIIFTSGGSESNNIVLKGILKKGDHIIFICKILELQSNDKLKPLVYYNSKYF